MAVVVVGSFFTDVISYVDRLPQPGETRRGKSLVIGCGGKGANQCIAAAKLGAECAMVGKLGNDNFSEMHLSGFRAAHVNIDHVTKDDSAFTGLAQILVDDSAQNSIVIVGGANDSLSPEDVVRSESLIGTAKVVVTQLEVNMDATLEAMRLANELGEASITGVAHSQLLGVYQANFYAKDILPRTKLTANQASWCKWLGPSSDPLSQLHINVFDEQNVALTAFRSHQTSTGTAVVMVNETGANAMISIPGANLELTEEEVESVIPVVEKATVLVVALGVRLDATRVAMRAAAKKGVKTIFNAAPATMSLPEEVYRWSTVFCVNESEAEMLTGQSVDTLESAEKAGRILKSRGAHAVLLTLGGRGAYLVTGDENGIHIAAPQVKAIDTTGAGDSFIGTLAYFMAYNPSLPMEEMVRRSCIVASYSVQKPGTQVSFPNRRSELCFSASDLYEEKRDTLRDS